MEVFGIGPLELLLIFLLAMILLGPKDMVTGAKKLANWIRGVRESDLWKTTKEISDMPKKIMKETGLEDELNQMRDLSTSTVHAVIHEVSQEKPVEKKVNDGLEDEPASKSEVESPTIEHHTPDQE
jgi:Sec-independent protein translocase protein TatA